MLQLIYYCSIVMMKQPVLLETIKEHVKRRFCVSTMHWYNYEVKLDTFLFFKNNHID